MNVNKTILREFVDSKIASRKAELYKEIKNTVYSRMAEAVKTLLGDVSELERTASKFEDLLTEKIHLIGSGDVPEYSKYAASEANKMCKSHNYFAHEISTNALRALEYPNREYYRFSCNPLKETFNQLNSELQPKLKLYNEGLNQLGRELNNAISNETSGKRAYNALVALGMDMSDIPEANPNQLTVVKLSVDVCVLNGNCDDKVAV